MTSAQRTLQEIAQLRDDQISLERAALLIAAEIQTDLNVDAYLTTLDGLALTLKKKISKDPSIAAQQLIDFIHKDEQFKGNIKNYYAPENSYLNRVIDTRQGIPLSLALIHLAIGNRLDINIQGINFPGHFLIRYEALENGIIDPFTGRTLSQSDCATLLKQVAGPAAVMNPDHLRQATNIGILARLVDNLKQIHWRNKNWESADLCLQQQILLMPEHHEFRIQYGAVQEMKGDRTGAQQTYLAILQESKSQKIKETAAQRLLSLEKKPQILH